MKGKKKKERILIVDDVKTNIQVIGSILKKENYEIYVANNGLNALKVINDVTPDLILLDIEMPQLDGFEACEQLKKNEATADIPVVFLTGKVEIDDIVKGFEVGAVDYLTKPCNSAELKSRIKTHLELKNSRELIERQYDKLKKLEHLRESLTYMLIHDLKNPLSSIAGYAFMLSNNKDIIENASVARYLSKIEYSVRTLSDMIMSILDVAKGEESKLNPDKIETDFQQLLDEIKLGLEPQLDITKTSLSIIVEDGTPIAYVDKDLVRRVFVNIIGNGIKYAEPETEISVVVKSENKKIRAQVKDRGKGIPKEYQKKIFEKFAQLELKKANGHYSTGLGLAFCKLAVEAHGGEIGVESDGKSGSTFWFTLPVD